MPMFEVNVKHGRTLEDARGRLAMAVDDVRRRFGTVVKTVEWSTDGDAVTMAGGGVTVSMRVDAESVHVTGDIPVLAALLGKPFEAGLKQIVQKSFSKG